MVMNKRSKKALLMDLAVVAIARYHNHGVFGILVSTEPPNARPNNQSLLCIRFCQH
jgi:hypothetical protein